ncbi:MAG: ATP-binding cassette domain-containing protein [Candidatus Eisenbacteria bacterium]|nr:ATP-binding cassette domain-containing protein [Candidatus Eisenbacteria bacterium]
MLRLTKISKSFGGQVLFRDVDWFVERRDRVALIGTNGSGKSTLLKMIAGLENADRGTIELPRSAGIGYLAQQGFLVGRGTVREEAREAFQAVLALQGELLEVEAELKNARPEDPGVGRLAQRHHEILERLAILGADDIEREIHRVLTGLGFRDEDFDRPVGELSGGWQMRVALARILLQKPELLLLDEPTNHLDLEAREWLESYLQEYPHAFVLVSHDRYFLDVTVKRTTEIAEQGLDNYAGNYSLYERERDKRYELRLKAYERQQEEIRRLEQFIARNRANKKLAGRTHSRMLVLEKMVRLTPPASPRVGPRIRFPQCPASGRVALELRGVAKSYGAKRVFSGVDLAIMRGARVALVGPNGAGKSTLMRLLSGREAPDRGEWAPGHQTQIAFFAQDEGTRIDPGSTVHEAVLALAPTDFVPEVRGLLGAFLFSGDAVEKRVSALSGGELNRLAIACLLVRPSNLLLLDEPTNHLDLAAKEALLTSLAAYPGTVVFVSHDRHFLENLATHVVDVGHGRIAEYPGSYASYLYRRDLRGEGPAGESVSQAAPQAVPLERARAAKQAEPRTPPRPNAQATRDAEMRRPETQASEERNGAPGAKGSRGREASPARGGKPGQADQRRLRDIRAIEASIEELEDRKARFGRALANPVLYADQEKSTFYLREIEAAERKLAELYRKWEHLQGGSR